MNSAPVPNWLPRLGKEIHKRFDPLGTFIALLIAVIGMIIGIKASDPIMKLIDKRSYESTKAIETARKELLKDNNKLRRQIQKLELGNANLLVSLKNLKEQNSVLVSAITELKETQNMITGAGLTDDDALNVIAKRQLELFEKIEKAFVNGEIRRAHRLVRELLEAYPGYIPGWISKAKLELSLYNLEGALEAINHALKLEPNNASALELKASVTSKYGSGKEITK